MLYPLTETEVEALNGVLASDYMDGATGASAIGKQVWAWSANPFENKKVFSGACSKLKQKGYILCRGEGPNSTIAITRQGFKALEASGNGAPRKPVEAPKPATPAKVAPKPAKAYGTFYGASGGIVTARKPPKAPKPPKAATEPVQNEPEAKPKPVAKPMTMGSIIKLHWRDAVIVAEIIAETNKAWKLVAINRDVQDGFECWFPKSAFENIQNSSYQLAEWFFKYANSYTFSWLWSNVR